MSASVRAILIGMFGPALQAAGVAWDLLEHGVFAPVDGANITFVHIISGPAHLLMATGFAVSVVCIPLALQVVTAKPEELESPAHNEADLAHDGPFQAAEAAK